MNAGDSYRVAVEQQSPRRVPASSRLPRGFCAWFLLQIPMMGNFTASNQPHIPPGFTDSPQADTEHPAAKENLGTTRSLYLRPEGHRFTEHLTSRERKLNGPPKVLCLTFGEPFKISLIRFYEQQEHLNCSFAFWRHVCNNGSV